MGLDFFCFFLNSLNNNYFLKAQQDSKDVVRQSFFGSWIGVFVLVEVPPRSERFPVYGLVCHGLLIGFTRNRTSVSQLFSQPGRPDIHDASF